MSPRSAFRLRPPHRYTLAAALAAVGILTATVTAGPATSAPASVTPRSASCPSGAAPSSQYAVLKKVAIESVPTVIAVDDDDDSVYIGTTTSPAPLWVFDGKNGWLDDSVPVAWPAQGIAVHQADDTVYVSVEGEQYDPADDTLVVLAGTPISIKDQITVGDNPVGVAVNQVDDTVYVANSGQSEDGDTLSIINGHTNAPEPARTVAFGPKGVAILRDDTVFVASYTGFLSTIDGSEGDDSFSIGTGAAGLAIDQDDDTIYIGHLGVPSVQVILGENPIADIDLPVTDGVPNVALDQTTKSLYATTSFTGDTRLFVINGATNQLDDTIFVGGIDGRGIAVDQYGDNQGIVYVANGTDLVVVGQASASLTTTSGAAGSGVTVNVTAPQVTYPLDDTTVTLVCFGSAPATNLMAGTDDDTWSVTAPSGTPGSTVPVTVTLDGGLRVSAGSFSYAGSPPGPVSTPPGPPSDVAAIAGDAMATVTWLAPTDPGTYPVTDYEVASSPEGRACLVRAPALTCEVAGLTNGTSYTFNVRARNNSGWGTPSSPSTAVTPTAPIEPSIVITGSRPDTSPPSVRVTGSTTGLIGEQVVPSIRFPGETSYATGSARPIVSADGTFTWSRKTVKKIYVYFQHDDLRSNRVIIAR